MCGSKNHFQRTQSGGAPDGSEPGCTLTRYFQGLAEGLPSFDQSKFELPYNRIKFDFFIFFRLKQAVWSSLCAAPAETS